jgi:predicted dehydrogenase
MPDTVTNPVRWGVVSTAKIGREKVIPGMKTSPWVDLAAISSRDLTRGEAVAADHGIARVYGSTEALLADPEIEAVYIPLPNDRHVDVSLQAAAAGKHVLCEKPAAMSLADAERLRAIPAGIVYAEAFMVRQHPQWLKVRELIADGRIGRVVAMQCWFAYMNRDPANIRNRPETGGGALMDIGCYPLTVSRFILGAEPRRVVATLERDPDFGTDRTVSALVDFGPGLQLTFMASTQASSYQRFLVIGTEGRLEVMIPFNAPQGLATVVRLDRSGKTSDEGTETIELAPSDQYGLQAEAMSKAIRGVEPMAFGVEDAIQTMRLIEACFRSAAENRWIDV